MKIAALFGTLLLVISSSFSQKPALSAKEYDIWNTLKSYTFSDNGRWIIYESTPYRGDGRGVIMRSDSSQARTFQRFSPSAFLGGDRYVIGNIKPQFDTIRQLELDKVKKEKWPKDSLLIYNTVTDSIVKIPNIIDFKYVPNALWLAYRNQDQAAQSKPKSVEKKKFKFFKFLQKKIKAIEVPKIESDGKVLTLWHPELNKKMQLDYISSYEFSDSAKFIALIDHRKKNKKDQYALRILDVLGNNAVYVSDTFTQIGKMAWDKSQNYFAFLASRDTNSNNKHFSLYHLDLNGVVKLTVLDSAKIAHPEAWIPSNFAQLSFAEDSKKLFFGLAPRPTYDPKDTLTAAEKVKLDLWHWQDQKLQPRQLLTAKKDKNPSFLSYYDWEKDAIEILENDSLKVRFNAKQTDIFLATNDDAYSVSQDFDFPWKRDEYMIAPTLGFSLDKPFVLKKASKFGSILSPDGAYVVQYKEDKNEFILFNVKNQSVQCLTCGMQLDWFEDLNGQIYEPLPEVKFYWENDRRHVLMLTEHDLYRINIENSENQRITSGIGKELKQGFDLIRWDADSLYYDPNRMWLKGFSMLNKTSNIYSLNNWKPALKKNLYANISSLQITKTGELVSYKISTVQDFPDLTTDNLTFSAPKQITAINPQQKDFNWAKVDLVQWKTKEGVDLEGLLYIPENLDPSGSYPMIVYYYELNSDNIHRHWTPRPTASIVFPTEYASGGYVIFVPDIRYQPGHPARGAYQSIMSGTDYVLSKYKFIDSTRMGLQGQSWGGYQSAQLITMTTRYKAAMAGAPVSNMISAYGGIRWSSGMSRQFQYEHTQSRIGATIWEKPELYIQNSPIFGLPNVQTPLLIMHNDNDGAVPWYQGIELFMGLRRLQKPVWLLNYNGDEHNLMNEAHRRDLSIRMRSFFDYYLNNGDMPSWMKDGIKAIDK